MGVPLPTPQGRALSLWAPLAPPTPASLRPHCGTHSAARSLAPQQLVGRAGGRDGANRWVTDGRRAQTLGWPAGGREPKGELAGRAASPVAASSPPWAAPVCPTAALSTHGAARVLPTGRPVLRPSDGGWGAVADAVRRSSEEDVWRSVGSLDSGAGPPPSAGLGGNRNREPTARPRPAGGARVCAGRSGWAALPPPLG